MQQKENKSPNNPHPHKYTIADEDAVRTLMNKLEENGGQTHQRKILGALETAMDEFETADEKTRKAFFHGMLTGYSVALKLTENTRQTGQSSPHLQNA